MSSVKPRVADRPISGFLALHCIISPLSVAIGVKVYLNLEENVSN